MKPRAKKRWRMGCTAAAAIVLLAGVASCFRGVYVQHTSRAGGTTAGSLTRGALYLVRTDNRDAAVPPAPGTRASIELVFGSPRVIVMPTGMLRSTSGAISGFNLCLPLWILLLPAGVPAAWMWWRELKDTPHRCRSCGYDLTGLRGTICPECGEATKGGTRP